MNTQQAPRTISINSILCSHARLSGCELEWRGAPIAMEAVFDNSHLMPVLTTVASIKGVHLLKWDLGVSNEMSKEGLLGMTSVVPPVNLGPNQEWDSIRALFYMHAAEKVFGLSRGGVIECYPVFEYFHKDVHERAKQAQKANEPLAKSTQRSQQK